MNISFAPSAPGRKIVATLATSAVLALASVGAHADVVYGSLVDSPAQAVYSQADPFNFVTYNYFTQTFASSFDPLNPEGEPSEAIFSVGDKIALTPNTGRALTGITVGLVKYANTQSATVQMTVSLYDAISPNGPNGLLASLSTSNITLSAVGNLNNPAAIGRQFNIQLPVSGSAQFNLPDTFYYMVSLSNRPAGLGVLLYDYYYDTGLIGTDLGTVQDDNGDYTTIVYGQIASAGAITSALGTVNTGLLSDGFTPAVQFEVATPVPEPTTLVMMLAGLLGLGALARKRSV